MSSRQLDASTEEILASIRDMMAAEGGEQVRPRTPVHTNAPVLELTDIVDVSPKEVVQLMEDQVVKGEHEGPFTLPKTEPAPRPASQRSAARTAEVRGEESAPRAKAQAAGTPKSHRATHAAAESRRREERMISEKTAAQTTATLAHLIQAKVQHRASQAISVEELVLEAVRPLLGVWLDEHLPEIVERVVEVEIKKLLSR